MNAMNDYNRICIGCGEWGFRDLPMEQHFKIARSFGFQFLEFGIGGGRVGRLSEAPDAEDVGEFIRLGEEYKIATPFCCLENDFTLTDRLGHRAMVEKVLKQMAIAKACLASHVRLFAGFTPLSAMTEPLWKQLLDTLFECQSMASKLGLQIAIETHGAIEHSADGSAVHSPTVTTDRIALERLLREMPKEIGINYDPGNIKAAEGVSSRLHLDLLNSRINYCHLKDWHRQGEGWVACGVGDDDLHYGKLLRDMCFDGVYLIEYEPLHDTEDGIRRSLASLENSGLSIEFGRA